MPDEPLIFVEIALGREIPDSIQAILADREDVKDNTAPTTATFYSISNCQAGLAGISFGNSLIKTVVSELRREFDSLQQFVTLSPLPKFAAWLANQPVKEPGPADDENLAALAACYLVHAKTPDHLPYDPVARFHLGNGANIHALHTDADLSDTGKTRSHGVMVNYLYDLKQLEVNHEKFVTGNQIACASKIREQADHINKQLKL